MNFPLPPDTAYQNFLARESNRVNEELQTNGEVSTHSRKIAQAFKEAGYSVEDFGYTWFISCPEFLEDNKGDA